MMKKGKKKKIFFLSTVSIENSHSELCRNIELCKNKKWVECFDGYRIRCWDRKVFDFISVSVYKTGQIAEFNGFQLPNTKQMTSAFLWIPQMVDLLILSITESASKRSRVKENGREGKDVPEASHSARKSWWLPLGCWQKAQTFWEESKLIVPLPQLNGWKFPIAFNHLIKHIMWEWIPPNWISLFPPTSPHFFDMAKELKLSVVSIILVDMRVPVLQSPWDGLSISFLTCYKSRFYCLDQGRKQILNLDQNQFLQLLSKWMDWENFQYQLKKIESLSNSSNN